LIDLLRHSVAAVVIDLKKPPPSACSPHPCRSQVS
jgi:hypothetical protein